MTPERVETNAPPGAAVCSKLRVLHLNAGNLLGGIERVLLTLAQFQREASSIDSSFAVCFKGQFLDHLRRSGTSVDELGEVRVRNPWTVVQARRCLQALLDRDHHDVVICHSPWCLAIFGPAARRSRLPLLLWVHGALDRKHWVDGWARWHRPDFAICNSQFTQSTLDALFPGLASEVLYCPVSPRVPDRGAQSWSMIRGELDTPPDAIVVVHASRMEEWKGHRILLQALAGLRSSANWVAWFAGGAQSRSEERYLDELKGMAYSSGIGDSVRFLGQRSDVPSLMSAGDIYCHPNSSPEPFGIAIVEALYAGLPVVTSAIGGPREIVDQTCGILVPPRDVAALTAALHSLMQDPLLRARLGARGPARARQMSDPARRLRQLEGVLLSRFSTRKVTAELAPQRALPASGSRL
ncbi:MAG TPA: glycosyltransferase family 4 protein [Terriglobales bacterium]|nr:glycosyltransferase family 4 protein [Terriglobales bacterium]